ncbi:hypothetical protein [Pseudomonas sp.]|uniref:hypothetical protein n=1 Tax=Pseudomonas sp. TaxID=306 RepID=UPI003CC5A8C4
MATPYAFINEPMQTYMAIKSRLDLSQSAKAKFDILNAHIQNLVVLPGQLVLVPDTDTPLCTAQEAHLMGYAREVKHSIMTNGPSGDGFALRNYDLLQSMLGNTALGVGAASGGWSAHLSGINETLGTGWCPARWRYPAGIRASAAWRQRPPQVTGAGLNSTMSLCSLCFSAQVCCLPLATSR